MTAHPKIGAAGIPVPAARPCAAPVAQGNPAPSRACQRDDGAGPQTLAPGMAYNFRGHWRHDHGCGGLSPGQKLAAGRMPEDDGHGSLEWHLRAYLKDLGLTLAYHPWRQHAQRAREGWPDWAITGPGGFIVRELKRQNKAPTKAQDRWLESLLAAGIDVAVWKPCCVLSGRMAWDLARLAGIGAR